MADTTKKPEESVIDPTTKFLESFVDAEELKQAYGDTAKAAYASKRTDLANTTNQYYNNLYNTQNTVMDTIRQSNAQAVASGASKGVQAANTLSALLGLQNESVQGATDLANESIKLAQDETAAVMEAEQKAMTDAQAANAQNLQNYANYIVQDKSVDVEAQNAATATSELIAKTALTDPELAEELKEFFKNNFGIDYNPPSPTPLNITQAVDETTKTLKEEGYADANAKAVAQFYQGDWVNGNYNYDFFLKYDNKNNGGFSREGAIANGINNLLSINNAQVTRVQKTDPKYQTYTYDIVIPKSALSDAEYNSLKNDLGTAIKPNGNGSTSYYTITMSANSGKYASWGTTLSEIGAALKKIRPDT